MTAKRQFCTTASHYIGKPKCCFGAWWSVFWSSADLINKSCDNSPMCASVWVTSNLIRSSNPIKTVNRYGGSIGTFWNEILVYGHIQSEAFQAPRILIPDSHNILPLCHSWFQLQSSSILYCAMVWTRHIPLTLIWWLLHWKPEAWPHSPMTHMTLRFIKRPQWYPSTKANLSIILACQLRIMMNACSSNTCRDKIRSCFESHYITIEVEEFLC